MEEIKPYSTSQDNKREQVERMFDGIARHYDLLNHVLSFGIDKGWRRTAIGMVAEGSPKRVLDVATGTADMALALHRSMGCHVVGCDISQKMIEIGKQKVTDADLAEHIELQVADAEALPFADGTFDATTIAFGVRNFAHVDAGLADMARVLRSGARLAVLEFSTPTNAAFRSVYNFYFKNILPLVGGAISQDRQAYDYLCQSAMAFPSGTDFMTHLEAAGLKPLTFKPLTCGIATVYLAEKP